MTRKDFELIAAVVKDLPARDLAKWTVANAFAKALRGTNTGFKPERFMHACGFPECKEVGK